MYVDVDEAPKNKTKIEKFKAIQRYVEYFSMEICSKKNSKGKRYTYIFAYIRL